MKRLICNNTLKRLEKSRKCCQHGQSVQQTRFNARKRFLLNLVNICSFSARNIRRMIRRTQHLYSPVNLETSSPPTNSKLAKATTVSFFLLLSRQANSLPELQLGLDRFLCHTFITHRHLPIDIAQSPPFTKLQRNEKKLIKSHVVRSEIPRHVTNYILNYTASRYRTK
jgi:hypothetical protein